MKNLLTILFIFLSFQLLAEDVVRMKNGDVYKGTILEQKMNSYVQIQDKNGNERRLSWKNITKIEKEKVKLEEKRNTSEYGKVGKTLFLGTWGATIGYCLASGSCGSTAYLPVLGPIIANSSAGDKGDSSTKTLGIVSSLVQILGVTMWIKGTKIEKSPKKITIIPQVDKNKIQLFALYNF